jgi:WD40 repeat protein
MPKATHRAARPFLGLRPFGYTEHEFFFGRESQTYALYRFLDRSRFISVVGSSGSGKSSLVCAGLLPLLEAESQETRGRSWKWVQLTPGYSPLDSMTDALCNFRSEGNKDSGNHLAAARRDRVSFALRRTSFGIAEALNEIEVPQDLSFLIVVDQFEELFRYDVAGLTQRGERLTRGQRQELVAKFVQLLLEASRAPGRSIHVLITMRSDFIGDCARFYGLPEAVSGTQFLVPSLTRDQREEVIRRPLEKVSADIEPALVERLLNDGGKQLDDLPVLQHCLLRLWERAVATAMIRNQHPDEDSDEGFSSSDTSISPRKILLTEKQYRAIGGLTGALSQHADEILSTLPGLQLVAEQIFRALSEVDREGRATRRALAFEQLLEESGLPEDGVRLVVDRFRDDDCSFLVPLMSAQPNLLPGTRIDVGHEALLRQWKRISGKMGPEYALADQQGGWLWAEQDDGRFYGALVALVSGDQANTTMSLPLDQVEKRWSWWISRPRTWAWADRYGGNYQRVEQLFANSRAALQAEKDRQEAARRTELEKFEEARKRARIYRAAVFTFAALFVSAVGLSVFAWWLKNQATDARDRAREATAVAGLHLNEARLNESRYLEGLAQSKLRAGEVELAELIGLAALPTDMDRPERPVWPGAISILAEARAVEKALAVLRGHSNTIRSALFSPSDDKVITAASDNSARIWDARSGVTLRILAGHSDGVWYAAFSGDGKRAVTASLDHTARVWNVQTGATLAILQGHKGAVLSAVFSPDGRRVLTASADQTAGLWDADSGTLLAELKGHAGPVEAARFSPDGSYILTNALYDSTAYLWDGHSGQRIKDLVGHSDWVRNASFSPDGKRVVTASLDRTARIWDIESRSPTIVLSGHEGTVESAKFSRDGSFVITASEDHTARVWNAADGHRITVLYGHTGEVSSAEFSPDGHRIVTASADGTTRLWDVEDFVLLGTFRGSVHVVRDASFSADGLKVVTTSEDAVARIWNTSSGDMLTILKADAGSVRGASFSPDGRRIVSISQDMAARVWDVDTAKIVSVLQGHTNVLNRAQFSPDGKLVLTASVDETARTFDAGSGAPVTIFRGHTDEVTDAQFSPDGRKIVTSSRDESARLWQASTGDTIHELRGHEGSVTGAVFSPDGRLIATASMDKTARLWDVESGATIMPVLQGHDGPVLAVAFSPDGESLATASEDTTVRLWNGRTGAPRLVLRGHAGRVLGVTFSPDGKQVASAGDDGTARVWDVRTGGVLCILSGHTGPVTSVKYDRHQDRIITASDDQTSRVWDARTCATLALLTGHTGQLKSADFSPNGERIVTGSDDKTIRVWKTWPLLSADTVNYASASMIRSLTEMERRSLFSAQAGTASGKQGLSAAEICDTMAADPFDPKKTAPGVSVEQIDVEHALPACRSAVEQNSGEPRLQYELGRVLTKIGDMQAAFELYRVGADRQYAAAQFTLANSYTQDVQSESDTAAAFKLYQAAAENGYLKGYYELGELRWQGLGGIQNRREALQWFLKGAELGEPFSHLKLADLYESGEELEQASEKALLHYAIATRLLSDQADKTDAEVAQERRGALARALDPSVVVRIARDAQTWHPAWTK